jgi:hypothetical protein
MGINEENTKHLLHLILPNYKQYKPSQYKPSIRPNYKNTRIN